MSNAKMPAFPIAVSESDYAEYGLTKLEYFAGLALGGMMGNANCSPQTTEHFQNIALDAKTAALALIAELDKP